MHQEEGKRTCVVSELPCSKELDVEVKDKDRHSGGILNMTGECIVIMQR